jgi:hypothetical protein
MRLWRLAQTTKPPQSILCRSYDNNLESTLNLVIQITARTSCSSFSYRPSIHRIHKNTLAKQQNSMPICEIRLDSIHKSYTTISTTSFPTKYFLQLFLHPFSISITPLRPCKAVIISTSKPYGYTKLRYLPSKNQTTKYILTKILKLPTSLSLSHNNTLVAVKISLKTTALNLLRILLPNSQNFLVLNLKMLKPKPNPIIITLKIPTNKIHKIKTTATTTEIFRII